MRRVTGWLATHRKLVVAVIGAGITVAVQTWGADNSWVSLAILAATSAGVYGARNRT